MQTDEIRARLKETFASVHFSPTGHKYTINGEWAPSVTTIIGKLDKSDALLWWASKLSEETGDPWAWRTQRKKAADIGTEAHALIEHELRLMLGIEDDERPDVSDDAHYVFSGWKEWAASVNLEPVAVEQAICCSDPRYAGRTDLLGFVHGRLTVCDWKSSKGGKVYDEHKLQSHAYRHAIGKAIGEIPDGLVVVLPKEGPKLDVVPVDIPWSDACMTAFRGLVDTYSWCNESAREERKRKAEVA